MASSQPAPHSQPDDNRVDEAGQQRDEDEERHDLDALGHGARHDRRGGRAEHHLEEPVRSDRIAGVRIGFTHALHGIREVGDPKKPPSKPG